MPDYEIQEEEAYRYPDRGFVQGWVNLPATYTPGARSMTTKTATTATA
jgi:hypothetical protein